MILRLVEGWKKRPIQIGFRKMEVIVQSNSVNKFNDVPLTLSSMTRVKTTTVRVSL